ncbi:MAG: NAD-dependent epimerase/dehydratase family protein [Acidimicrobiales bacterium]
MTTRTGLKVAVTGPTGTFGFGLIPLLEGDTRIASILGIARRPFDPQEHGWSKMTYRQGDVRDRASLEAAFAGADVVVHLAFLITGGGASVETIRAINIEGSINAFRAAAAAGAKRFVYASSIAAYGFHADNPIGMTEEWPTRPADHLFYAQEKAELEETLAKDAAAHPELGLYLLRPPIVLGPHAIGGKSELANRLLPRVGRMAAGLRRSPVRMPVPVPDLPVQVIHEDDVGTAFLQCIIGAGPPGAYNIAAEGLLTGADLARRLGLHAIAVPAGPVQRLARRVAGLPMPSGLARMTSWLESYSHPSIMDTSKAQRDLGWKPQHSALDALRGTI